jgi:hypothetical protein
MVRFAHISQTRGDCSRALELLEAARPLFARSSQEKEIVLVDERIASITQQICHDPPFFTPSQQPNSHTIRILPELPHRIIALVSYSY